MTGIGIFYKFVKKGMRIRDDRNHWAKRDVVLQRANCPVYMRDTTKPTSGDPQTFRLKYNNDPTGLMREVVVKGTEALLSEIDRTPSVRTATLPLSSLGSLLNVMKGMQEYRGRLRCVHLFEVYSDEIFVLLSLFKPDLKEAILRIHQKRLPALDHHQS